VPRPRASWRVAGTASRSLPDAPSAWISWRPSTASEHGVRVETVTVDLIDPSAREALAARIDELGLDVRVLVNNTGFGGGGECAQADREYLFRRFGSTARRW
jgi:NAD(P)-dependent dehydrogenase (short-subunit alcohol dehydrogenase family)